MAFLSFRICLPGGGVVRRRLPWRRPWQKKKQTRKSIDLTTAFAPPPEAIAARLPEKSHQSILVQTALDYKTTPITHAITGLRFFDVQDRETAAGFLILDFDTLPPTMAGWDAVRETLEDRLSKLHVDGIFITSATGKVKLLVPVAHDLSGVRHGLRPERMAACHAVAGDLLATGLDTCHAASASAFFTRRGVDEFLWQTFRPLRAASLRQLVQEGRSLMERHARESDDTPHQKSSAVRVQTAQAVIAPTTHRRATRGARRLGQTLLPPAHRRSKRISGRPDTRGRSYDAAAMAALLMAGGIATTSRLRSAAEVFLNRKIPVRSFRASVARLKSMHLITSGSAPIAHVRSSGLRLSTEILRDPRVIAFYAKHHASIFPGDGQWHDFLFRLTVGFRAKEAYLDYLAIVPGFNEKPERLPQAAAAWDSHQRRTDHQQKV